MILRAIGRSFILLGVLILMFLAYQLWGTGIATDRYQRELEADLAFSDPATDVGNLAVEAGAEESKPQRSQSLDPGKGIAKIEIPKIGLKRVVVEGVSVRDLRKGPGHYPGTAMPGQKGNVVISGHRATYGEPFARLNEVGKGDVIKLTTEDGTFEYRVQSKKITTPDDIAVIGDFNDERVTLTTCHPRWSSKLRMIVVAVPLAPEADAA